MRLYLSSYHLGNNPKELISLLPKNPKAAIIMNAGDDKGDEKRFDYLKYEIDDLKKQGIHAEELDLREYFGKTDTLAKKLTEYDFVWVTGGNSFVLRRAMHQSGFDRLIKSLLKDDAIVYGGFSAGAVVMTPSLRGVDIVDDPNEIPEGYEKDIIWEGLGMVEKSIAPHYQSDHKESHQIEEVVEFFVKNKIDHWTLHDGEVVVVDGANTKLIV